MLDRLYDRIIALSQSPRAPYGAAAIAFAESSVSDPPDVILATMSLAQPNSHWRFGVHSTIASVLGRIVGTGSARCCSTTIGQWLIPRLRLCRQDGRV